MTGHALFGPAHIAWLLGIAIAAAWVTNLCRRNRLPPRALRAVLACLLVGCELQRYIHDGLAWPNGLPLQPCNVAAWVAVVACITLAPLAAEYVYFAGLAGAGIAVITPDMGAEWPPRFFITHGVLIATACVLTFGNLVPLRPGGVWRAYGLFLVNAALMGIFDYTFGANYLYLRGKPGSVTAYDWMGPWPVYLVSAGLFALALFWLLWLPWRYRGGQRPAVRTCFT
jgi:hypothetical integral membrane protein (TIGR02206 family)